MHASSSPPPIEPSSARRQRPEAPSEPAALREAAGRRGPARRGGVALGLSLAAAGAALALAVGERGPGGAGALAGLAALALHALLFPAAAFAWAQHAGGPRVLPWLAAGAVLLVGTAPLWPAPGGRAFRVALHVLGGLALFALLLAAIAARGKRAKDSAPEGEAAQSGTLRPREVGQPGAARRTLWAAAAGGAVALPAVALCGVEIARARRAPPSYDAAACYRFLTATTADQAGVPFFPSALQQAGAGTPSAPLDCTRSGCHAGVHSGSPSSPGAGGHAGAASNPAYRAALAEFSALRGEAAGRWCRGCHEPESLLVGSRTAGGSGRGIGCLGCHGVEEVRALHGSAPLRLALPPETETLRLEARLRAKAHAERFLRPALHRSATFCAACHRKHWNLPQNAFRWIPGPDEYRAWQTSAYSGEALFAPAVAGGPRSCLGCHDAHGGPPPRNRPAPALELEAFFRSAPRPDAGPAADPIAASDPRSARLRAPLFLDVVLRNAGIGHDFPTGMPDMWETWLEVRILDRRGRLAARHPAARAGEGNAPAGRAPSRGGVESAHAYRLVALDRNGRPVPPGRLHRMAHVAEWRRIPPGEADLARYRLPALPNGIGEVVLRVWRARRAGAVLEGEAAAPRLLAERRIVPGAHPPASEAASAWRSYGMALAAAKAYPQAIAALQRALDHAPASPETQLVLARVYLDEGELLAARETLERLQAMLARTDSGAPAAPSLADRARAWRAAVLRRMAQPDAAAALLEPLVRRYPRDLRLRFELGRVRMDQLRHAEAAREFEAMLDIDPVDVSAHFNLMLCQQRLNQLSRARIEETIYRLLSDEGVPGPPAAPHEGPSTSLEARPLHVHELEAVPTDGEGRR